MTPRRARASALLAIVLVLAACGGDEEVAGGAADLPGPVPEGTRFAAPAGEALAAPAFSAELVDGTDVEAAELWADRPYVLVFTASWCDRCRELHRDAAEAVGPHGDAVGLLGVAAADDAGAAGYADELDLGHPLAVASERVWLSYAAREPGLVVLVAKGGKVVRGWPGGATAEELAASLDDLVAT